MNQENARKRNWTIVKEFKHDETGILVAVSKSDDKRPRYSMLVGRKLEKPEAGGRNMIAPHIPFFVNAHHGHVTETSNYVPIISKLVADASQWITGQAQVDVDAYMVAKIEREKKQGYQERKAPMGLKALSKQDAARRALAPRGAE